MMLALHWPFGPWPLDRWPLRRRSRRTPVTLGIGRYRHSSLLARDGARDHSSTGRSNARRKRRFHHGEGKLDDRLTRMDPRHAVPLVGRGLRFRSWDSELRRLVISSCNWMTTRPSKRWDARSSWASISLILLRTMATASPNIVAAPRSGACRARTSSFAPRSVAGWIRFAGEATVPALWEGCRTEPCSIIPMTAPCVRWNSRCCG